MMAFFSFMGNVRMKVFLLLAVGTVALWYIAKFVNAVGEYVEDMMRRD